MRHHNIKIENAQIAGKVCIGIILNDINIVPHLVNRIQSLSIECKEISNDYPSQGEIRYIPIISIFYPLFWNDRRKEVNEREKDPHPNRNLELLLDVKSIVCHLLQFSPSVVQVCNLEPIEYQKSDIIKLNLIRMDSEFGCILVQLIL